MDPEVLAQMIAEDSSGLLVPEARDVPLGPEQRLARSYEEIASFVRNHGREPMVNPADMTETMLAMRLKAMSEDEAQRGELSELDDLGLLKEPEPPASIEELLATDSAGLTSGGAGDLFELRNVPKTTTMPAEVASRRPCEDFEKFQPLLEACHQELRSGVRDLISFRNEQQIEPGRFYVLKGILLYVAEAGDRERVGGKLNTRLRCIFENSTESAMLLRSLSAELYKNGRRVTEPQTKTMTALALHPETPLASVYVLRSLSADPQVLPIPDLYKIGSTKQTIGARTAGAPWETTFLGAPVELVADYSVPAGVEQRVERLLHAVFAPARLNAWFEQNGRTLGEVVEWFSVPLGTIDEAVRLIEADSIAEYEYDLASRALRVRGR